MIEITQTERWLLFYLPDAKIYKVLATWAGGFLDGDRWQANSGITKVVDEGDYYIFEGLSGSQYRCKKNAYGAWRIGYEVLENLKEKVPLVVYEKAEDCPILKNI